MPRLLAQPMENALTARSSDRFAGMDDPRVERAPRDDLLDIVAIVLCAVACRAGTWVDGETKGA